MTVLLVMQLYAAICSKVKKGETSLLAANSRFIINYKLFTEASLEDLQQILKGTSKYLFEIVVTVCTDPSSDKRVLFICGFYAELYRTLTVGFCTSFMHRF